MKKPSRQSTQESMLPDAITEALLLSVSPVMPETDRRDALRAKILAQASGTKPTAAQLQTIRADEGPWQNIAPLVDMKLLYDNGNSRSFLIRLQAGARLPPHDHPADEECMVLEGEGYIGGVFLRAGDYHLAPKGIRHDATHTATGALLFIRTAAPDYRAGA